ncbi:glycosyltransferase family 4 protein, partial [Clavibacter lycopersici]|uniref:glycosyltransferase family 4 protein n=1 Tax=Clavibacter lycopersici TaxID=2301718 RepID=UPI001F242F31
MTRPGGSARPAVEVLFPVERDLPRWSARHAAGEVPGAWPYGLDGLRAYDADVTVAPLRAPGRLDALRDRVAPLRRRPAAPASSSRDIGITWDENAARRMLLTRPHQEMYTGVIWVTDMLARGTGGDLGRMRDVLRRMDGLWVISRGQVEPLREFVGPGGPPVGFFAFGVDESFYPARPTPTRPCVVSVGGDRDRDPATLFAALARVHAAVPEAEIVVQSTSDLPAPAGVTKVPYFTHSELADLYARATVVAVATRDNLHVSGMTVSLEAMATGRPVVMTATPGTEDYVADGRTGILTPVGEPAAMADAVVGLLRDPARAADLGAAGRRDVETRLSSAGLVAGLAELIGVRREP